MQKLIINHANFTIEIEAEHETEILKKAAFWTAIPDDCPICRSPLRFNYRTPQTFEYYDLQCTGRPSHSISFGESKGTHNLYFDAKKEWREYNPGRVDDGQDQRQEAPAIHRTDDRPTSAIQYGQSADINAKRNVLLNIIRECKNAGISVGIIEVGRLSEEELERQTQNLADRLAAAPMR